MQPIGSDLKVVALQSAGWSGPVRRPSRGVRILNMQDKKERSGL